MHFVFYASQETSYRYKTRPFRAPSPQTKVFALRSSAVCRFQLSTKNTTIPTIQLLHTVRVRQYTPGHVEGYERQKVSICLGTVLIGDIWYT